VCDGGNLTVFINNVGGEFELGTMVTGPEYKDINALIS
jgi:hypothetical protein